MLIDTSKKINWQNNCKIFVAAKAKTIYDSHDILKQVGYEPFLLAIGDDHVVIQGHVYKYCGEVSDYDFNSNLI